MQEQEYPITVSNTNHTLTRHQTTVFGEKIAVITKKGNREQAQLMREATTYAPLTTFMVEPAITIAALQGAGITVATSIIVLPVYGLSGVSYSLALGAISFVGLLGWNVQRQRFTRITFDWGEDHGTTQTDVYTQINQNTVINEETEEHESSSCQYHFFKDGHIYRSLHFSLPPSLMIKILRLGVEMNTFAKGPIKRRLQNDGKHLWDNCFDQFKLELLKVGLIEVDTSGSRRFKRISPEGGKQQLLEMADYLEDNPNQSVKINL